MKDTYKSMHLRWLCRLELRASQRENRQIVENSGYASEIPTCKSMCGHVCWTSISVPYISVLYIMPLCVQYPAGSLYQVKLSISFELLCDWISSLHIYPLLKDQGAQCMTYIHNFYKASPSLISHIYDFDSLFYTLCYVKE